MMLTWIHIGDLHLTEPHEQNHADFRRLIDTVSQLSAGAADFVLLPGDNADDGTPEQFRLVREAVASLPMPLHILPGDHDYKPKNLNDFHEVLGARRLPYAATVRSHRCLFLDVVSAGTGGPDFRLDDGQLDWVEREVAGAADRGEDVAVFMHTYPADLRAGGSRLNKILAARHVLSVDMGHTHYNELANDGRTIFMATRSTGQIEEGPVGFSVAALDAGGASWRFKPLDQAWPFVLVTAPTDRQLVTEGRGGGAPASVVRARVLGDAPVVSVHVSAEDGPWHAMEPRADDPATWEAPLPKATGTLRVRALDARGREDQDEVALPVAGWQPPRRIGDGSDADRLPAWPAKGLFDTQLGPNRNGRKW